MTVLDKIIINASNPILVADIRQTGRVMVKVQNVQDGKYVIFTMSHIEFLKTCPNLTSVLTGVSFEIPEGDIIGEVVNDDLVILTDNFQLVNNYILSFPKETYVSNCKGETIKLGFGVSNVTLTEIQKEGFETLTIDGKELEHFKALNRLYSSIIGIESLGSLSEEAEEVLRSLERHANSIGKVVNDLNPTVAKSLSKPTMTVSSDLEVLRQVNQVKTKYGGRLKTTVYYCVDYFNTVFFTIDGEEEYYEVSPEDFVKWSISNINIYHLVDTVTMEEFELKITNGDELNLGMKVYLGDTGLHESFKACKGVILTPYKAVVMDEYLKYTVNHIHLNETFISNINSVLEYSTDLTDLIGRYEVYILRRTGKIESRESFTRDSMTGAIDSLTSKLELIKDLNSLGVLEIKNGEGKTIDYKAYTKHKIRVK